MSMMITRRSLGIAAIGSIAARTALAQAPAYPSRPVTVMVPFAPGGVTDIVARLVATDLGAAMGRPFVVENRPGASGTVGMAWLARAQPDGYTLGIAPNGAFAFAPALFESLPYNNDTAFSPIGMLANAAMFLCVRADSPYRTLADLIAASRAQPGRITVATAGAGVANHLTPELLQEMAGVSWENVSYRSGPEGMQAVLSGDVVLSFIDAVVAIPLMRDRRLRALGYSVPERNLQAPEIPTIAEQGFPGFRGANDIGLFAPAGTPRAIVDRLGTEMRRVMLSDAMKERLAAMTITPVGGSPDEFAVYLATERPAWASLIRRRNIKPG